MLAYSFDEPASLNPLLELFREVNETLAHVAHYILRFTTVAIFSLLAGLLATSLDESVAVQPLKWVLIVVTTLVVTGLIHMLLNVPALFLLITRRNPFSFIL
ncbi:unnamed protein product [Hyaloperonospora brassicae]|uniref:Amino acid transporter n=1 Tax=Hyaloperonospora brassicae TaxID=162125 RepID=A0AAV0TSL2_HYABA|nr:unnamed protein product [Hyaloperonospora brassicae]